MDKRNKVFSLLMIMLILSAIQLFGQTLKFSGRIWKVRPTSEGKPPGNNNWSQNNAWVDSLGQLHLKISYSKNEDKWRCAEVFSADTFSFGMFQLYVIGRLDSLDKNIVLGFFQYGGEDGQNEIDIEMATFLNESEEKGYYSVYPSKPGLDYSSEKFMINLTGNYTTHRYTWKSDSVIFQTLGGHREDDFNEIVKWNFIPSLIYPGKNFRDYIPQKPMPFYINFWLRSGKPPNDGKEAEIIIKNFKYLPE